MRAYVSLCTNKAIFEKLFKLAIYYSVFFNVNDDKKKLFIQNLQSSSSNLEAFSRHSSLYPSLNKSYTWYTYADVYSPLLESMSSPTMNCSSLIVNKSEALRRPAKRIPPSWEEFDVGVSMHLWKRVFCSGYQPLWIAIPLWKFATRMFKKLPKNSKTNWSAVILEFLLTKLLLIVESLWSCKPSWSGRSTSLMFRCYLNTFCFLLFPFFYFSHKFGKRILTFDSI